MPPSDGNLVQRSPRYGGILSHTDLIFRLLTITPPRRKAAPATHSTRPLVKELQMGFYLSAGRALYLWFQTLPFHGIYYIANCEADYFSRQ